MQQWKTRPVYARTIVENGLSDMEDYYLAVDALERVRKGNAMDFAEKSP